MIPLAVELQGFLSFRTPEKLDFSRPGVALLHGQNAAGKSTIFDAVLCALFGGHRGGPNPSVELINKQCDRAQVAFEFQLGTEKYRAVRDLERVEDVDGGKEKVEHTPHLYHWESTSKGERWEPVKQATKKRDFDKRIQELIGLSYEAFTSSVLLMQDRARVLVSQELKAPEHRFEVLARLVGLEFYQQFHKLADERRLDLGRKVKSIEADLKGIAPVLPAELEQAALQIETARKQVETEEANVAALAQRHSRATEWTKLSLTRLGEQKKWDEAERLLGDAATVERNGRRWQELDTVVPALIRLLEHRAAKAAAEAEIASLHVQGEADRRLAAEIELRRERVHKRQTELDDEHTGAEQRCREDIDRQRELAHAVNPLRRLRANRDKLLDARRRYSEVNGQAKPADADVQNRQSEMAALEEAARQAEAADRAAEGEVVRTRTEWQAIQRQAERFDTVKDAQKCSYCGQDVTPEHAAKEKARIDRELAERQIAIDKAMTARKAAADAKTIATQALADGRQAVELAQQRAADLSARSALIAQEGKGYAETLAAAYAELAPAWQTRVAPTAPTDWGKTTFPTPDELTAFENELKALNDRVAAHEQKDKARKTEAATLRQEKDQADAERKSLDERLNIAAVKLARAEQAASGASRAEKDVLTALPESWRDEAAILTADGLQTLSAEREQLRQRDAAGRWNALQQARAGRDALRLRLDDLAGELQKFGEHERCHPDEAARDLTQAQHQEREARGRKINWEAAHRALEERRERRAQLDADFLQTDKKRIVAKKLTDLLDESNLQRHILRDKAEDAVIANANGVLESLMGGQLRLCRAADEKGKALQLEAEFLATGQRRSLTFLSGSEQFRVAISLALGIGQFASRGQKPIEAVIIDEGFGCLDQNNRRLMIDEIRRLEKELKCILLVSHQEEFAEAFPGGYHFELVDGSTQITTSR